MFVCGECVQVCVCGVFVCVYMRACLHLCYYVCMYVFDACMYLYVVFVCICVRVCMFVDIIIVQHFAGWLSEVDGMICP